MSEKTKRPLAPWTRITTPGFRSQAAALRPGNGAAGGVKARSASEELRMAIYLPIAALFKHANPWCQCCSILWRKKGYDSPRQNRTESIHHVFGREGLLLFDVRGFKSACLECHRYIDAHRDEARKLGLLADAGDWNKHP